MVRGGGFVEIGSQCLDVYLEFTNEVENYQELLFQWEPF